MTALNSPIPLTPKSQPRGSRVDDFVDRLSHPAPAHGPGAIVATILATISFGLLPLLLWPTRWSEFTETERHDLLDLCAWWRRRVSPDDAKKLDKISSRFRARPILMVLIWLAVSFNFMMMATLLFQGDTFSRLWDFTFKHIAPFHDSILIDNHWISGLPLEQFIYPVWMIGLSAAYFLQWYAVRSHAVAVQSLVKWTNKIGRENQFMRIKQNATRIGLGPPWIIIGIAMCSQHIWWAVPMVFAGAMQRRYMMQSSPNIRMALASQARDGFTISTSEGDHFCNANHCGARLPAQARFCPRCGTGV